MFSTVKLTNILNILITNKVSSDPPYTTLNSRVVLWSEARRLSAVLTLVSFGGWFPVLCTNDRQADLSFLINVGVVDLRLERDLWGFKRIFCREDDLNPECSFVIWRVILEKKMIDHQISNKTVITVPLLIRQHMKKTAFLTKEVRHTGSETDKNSA